MRSQPWEPLSPDLLMPSPDGPAALDGLAGQSRRRLLWLLAHKPRTVTELVEATALRQPTVSKHLRVLEPAGLVQAQPHQQDRRRRVYQVERQALRELIAWAV